MKGPSPSIRRPNAEPRHCWPANAEGRRTRPRHFVYLPIGLFASVMGLTGLSVAWRLASQTYRMPGLVADGLAVVAVALFLALGGAYVAKAVSAPDVVRAEYQHPVTSNLFGTIFISLLLIPIVIAPIAPVSARVIWCIGLVGMLGFAWLMIDRWMSDRQQVEHATPAWMVPVVGLLDVPLAVPVLNLPQANGVMVFCVAVGMFFAIPLFTIILSRLLFEAPMAEQLQPMLLILVAPFAVGFSAYVATTGRVDLFAESLYGLTLFLLTVLLGRLRRLAKCCPFRTGWWAISFPLAASASAATRFAGMRPGPAVDGVALVLLTVATVVIAGLAIRTVAGILRGELRNLV